MGWQQNMTASRAEENGERLSVGRTTSLQARYFWQRWDGLIRIPRLWLCYSRALTDRNWCARDLDKVEKRGFYWNVRKFSESTCTNLANCTFQPGRKFCCSQTLRNLTFIWQRGMFIVKFWGGKSHIVVSLFKYFSGRQWNGAEYQKVTGDLKKRS